MCLADASFRKLDVFGPPGLMHQLAAMRNFLFRFVPPEAHEYHLTPYFYSDEIDVTVSELDMSQPPSVRNPQAVFQDERITVYAIPLLTHTHEEVTKTPALSGAHEDHTPSLKRARTPSPDTFAKKRRYLHDSTASRDSAPRSNRSLLGRGRTADLMPHYLTGEEAGQWRNYIIGTMFSYIHVPEARVPARRSQVQNSASTGQSASDTAVDTPTVPAPRKPWLDRFTRLRRLPPLLDQKSTSRSCYVCVGPKVRGRFDSEKAKELGIPNGPLRRDLTQGKTVTFEVNDGKGGKIQRTVRSEEVVLPSEIPKVSGHSHRLLDFDTHLVR